VSSLRFSPDGKLLAVGDFGGGLLLWDLAGNGPTATIDARPPGTRREDEHSGSPLLGGFRFSPDGKSLVVFPSHDGQLRTWDVATHRPIESLTTARDLNLGDLHQQPDGKSFALGYSVDAVEAGLIGNEPTRLLLWNLTAKKAVWSKAEVSPFGTAKFSADGRRVILFEPSKDAEQHPPKQVLVLDRATGRTIATYRSDDEIKDAVPSPDGELLAVALGFNNADNQPRHPGEIRMVDAETGRPVARVVLDEPGWPAHLTFSSDGRQIAALGGNGSVKVWRVAEILEP
jgi:WD40 repeat protein